MFNLWEPRPEARTKNHLPPFSLRISVTSFGKLKKKQNKSLEKFLLYVQVGEAAPLLEKSWGGGVADPPPPKFPRPCDWSPPPPLKSFLQL